MLKKSEQKRKNGNHPKKNQILGVYPQVVRPTVNRTSNINVKSTGNTIKNVTVEFKK